MALRRSAGGLTSFVSAFEARAGAALRGPARRGFIPAVVGAALLLVTTVPPAGAGS